MTGVSEDRCWTAHPDGRLLHLDDYPETLRLLAAVLHGRSDYDRLGYHPTDHGVFVDWDTLVGDAPLSSTQVAAAHIARGCAVLERSGGVPANLAEVVSQVVTAVAYGPGRHP